MRAALLALTLALAACEPTVDVPPPPSARCVGCHRAEYEREHAGAIKDRKPATCAVCHTERAWRPTSVRHRWPLTGAHQDAWCSACHTGAAPVYEGTPTRCIGCHRDDYERARTPPHARLSQACATCHSTDGWSPALGGDAPAVVVPVVVVRPTPTRPTVPTRPTPTRPTPVPVPVPEPVPPPVAEPTHPESRFPITRGNHAGITCARCHDRGGPRTRDNTDCVQCHARARFDGIHDSVGGYPSGSAAPNFCVRCHTRGTRSRR